MRFNNEVLLALLLLSALGIASAVPQFSYNIPIDSTDLEGIDLGTQGRKNTLEDVAKSQYCGFCCTFGVVLPFIVPPPISGAKGVAKGIA